MIANFKLTVLIGIIAILYSCSNSSNKKIKENNKEAIKNLALKYNADTTWDSKAHYSFDLQEMFIESKKLMLFKGRIYDIIIEDSNYVVKILDEREDEKQNYLASITFNSDQFASIFKENKSTRGVFIIKVSKVTSSIPSIKEDEGIDNDDNTYTYTHLSDDADKMIQIFHGELIDFHLDEIDKKK